MSKTLPAFFAALLLSGLTAAQTCPGRSPQGFEDASQAVTANGILKLHLGLRAWLEFAPQKPICGVNSFQVTFENTNEYRRLNSYRNCRAKVTGKIYAGMTAYYETEFAIGASDVRVEPPCKLAAIPPDSAKAVIPVGISRYYVALRVSYRGEGRLEKQVWKDEARTQPLSPVEAFIHTGFNGSKDILWTSCADGFVLGQIVKSPGRLKLPTEDPNLIGLTFDPDNEKESRVTLSCVRDNPETK